MRFTDKVAIVTGGGTGIGKGAAIALAAERARVLGTRRRLALLTETVEENPYRWALDS